MRVRGYYMPMGIRIEITGRYKNFLRIKKEISRQIINRVKQKLVSA